MKKTSTLTPSTEPAIDTRAFGRVFLIDGTALTLEPGFPEGAEPKSKAFKSEHEFERFVSLNWKLIFGEGVVGISARAEGLEYPFEAFLFDFTQAKARCYFLTVYLGGDPLEETFRKITRTFAYLRDPDLIRSLIDNLTDNIEKDKRLAKGMSERIGEQPIPEFIEDMIAFAKVLLVTDEDRPEYSDFVKAYPETWDSLLDIMFMEKYQVGKQVMLSMHPSLADFREKPKQLKEKKEKVIHAEDHHFAKSEDAVRTLYAKLKAEVLKIDKSVVFVPDGKHYIAMKSLGGKNSAFFHFRKSAIYLVVKVEEKIVRKMVKHHEIKSLPESVQKFWNGASTGLVISKAEYLKEITDVLKVLIKK